MENTEVKIIWQAHNMKEYIAMLRNTIIVFMLSCHKDLQCTGGGHQKEWQEQAVCRGWQPEATGKSRGKEMRPASSSLNQTNKWGPTDLPVSSAGIWTPWFWMFFRVCPPHGLFSPGKGWGRDWGSCPPALVRSWVTLPAQYLGGAQVQSNREAK